jgi:hypothetical protein
MTIVDCRRVDRYEPQRQYSPTRKIINKQQTNKQKIILFSPSNPIRAQHAQVWLVYRWHDLQNYFKITTKTTMFMNMQKTSPKQQTNTYQNDKSILRHKNSSARCWRRFCLATKTSMASHKHNTAMFWV